MACAYDYQPIDFNDPLTAMLLAEEEDDLEIDVLHSQYTSGTHRTSTYEPERTEH